MSRPLQTSRHTIALIIIPLSNVGHRPGSARNTRQGFFLLSKWHCCPLGRGGTSHMVTAGRAALSIRGYAPDTPSSGQQRSPVRVKLIRTPHTTCLPLIAHIPLHTTTRTPTRHLQSIGFLRVHGTPPRRPQEQRSAAAANQSNRSARRDQNPRQGAEATEQRPDNPRRRLNQRKACSLLILRQRIQDCRRSHRQDNHAIAPGFRKELVQTPLRKPASWPRQLRERGSVATYSDS